jgi:hypothetical protein
METFDCSICFELFESSGRHQPCVIDCGHTLCLACVNKLKSLRNSARCPFCKTSISSQRNFPKNYSLLDAMASCSASLTAGSVEEGGGSSSQMIKERKLIEKTVEEYKEEKKIFAQNQYSLSNCTALLNQTRSQLTIVEQLTQQAQKDFDSSNKRLEDLKSVLRFLQLSLSHPLSDILLHEITVPTILPEPSAASTSQYESLSHHFR